eukprot:1212767-Amphidinium_carterae.1
MKPNHVSRSGLYMCNPYRGDVFGSHCVGAGGKCEGSAAVAWIAHLSVERMSCAGLIEALRTCYSGF